MLTGVKTIYSADYIYHTKLNTLSAITANKINLRISNSYKPDTYTFPVTFPIVAKSAPDSVIADSNYLPRTRSAIKNKIKYNAKDSIVYDAQDKSATLYSGAFISFEDYEMKSARIRINMEKHTINAVGEADSAGKLSNTPSFKQGSDTYEIEEVTFNYESKRGLMKEFRTQEGEGFIKGQKVKRDENNNFYIRDSYYTTCSDPDPHFAIKAKKLKVIPGSRVITGPANLVIGGVPTPLFVPFGIFPLKRGQQSGIIIPNYGNAKGRGFFLRQGGYYFGLGRNLDVTLIGDIYANKSWQIGTQINYSKKYHFQGAFNANLAKNITGLPEDKDYQNFRTFNITWNHAMDARAIPGTSFRADVNLVGNQYLVYNTYNNNTTAFNNNINSSVNFSKSLLRGKLNIASSARASQNTRTRDLTTTLPDINISVPSFQPFKPRTKPVADKWYEKTSVNYSAQLQNLLSTKDTILFKQRSGAELKSYLDSVMRNGMNHTFSVQNSFNLFKFYTLSVGANATDVMTLKTVNKTFDTASRQVVTNTVNGFSNAWSYSLRGGINTRFYGLAQFKKGKLVAIRHVLNPDLSFTYTPDFSQAKYGYYKKVQKDTANNTLEYSIYERSLYSGPGRGRQGNISFGLDNNLEIKWKKGKDTSEKVEKIKIFESIRISGSYNIFADSMNLSTIPVTFRTTLFKNISLNGGATLDPYINNAVKTSSTGYFTRINKFYLSENGKLGEVTNANIGLGASLTPEMFKGRNKERSELRKKEMSDLRFTELTIPWSLTFNYTINYDHNSKVNANVEKLIQTLSFNGTFNPTKNWFLNFNSGYDFRQKKISYLGMDIRREIHCWQFTFQWTPLSAYGYQYFIFNINVKSSVLHDLKVPKRKDWFDNRRI